MKNKIILMIAFISIFMIGCSNKNIESNLLKDGKAELESNKYTQAMKTLSSALEEDSSNDEARAMYMQAMKMKNVDNYINENNYKKAINELKIVEKINGGSSQIKKKASQLLKELEEKYEQEQKLAQERKENAKSVASNNADKLNEQILKEEEEAKKAEEENEQQESLENNNTILENSDNQDSVEQPNQNQSEQNSTEESNIEQNSVEQSIAQ